jgi:hypothetical protein
LERLKRRLEALLRERTEAGADRAGSTVPVQLDGSMGRLSRVDAIKSQRIAIGFKARQQQALLGVQGALDIAVPTAKQWCAYARAWLTVELRGDAPR